MKKLKYINPKKGAQVILFEGVSENINMVKRHKHFQIDKNILIHRFKLNLTDFKSFRRSLEISFHTLKSFTKTKKYKYIILDKWYLTSLFELNEKFLLDTLFTNSEDLLNYLKEFEKRIHTEFNYIKYITTFDEKISNKKYLHNSLDIEDDDDIMETREIVLKELVEEGVNKTKLSDEDLNFVEEYISLNSKNKFFKKYTKSFKKNLYSEQTNSSAINPKKITKIIEYFTSNKTKSNYK